MRDSIRGKGCVCWMLAKVGGCVLAIGVQQAMGLSVRVRAVVELALSIKGAILNFACFQILLFCLILFYF